MYRYHTFSMGSWLPLVIALAILLFAFEVWMLVDAALNKNISDKAKVWWIVGMVLIHPIVAIIYFFTDHRKR